MDRVAEVLDQGTRTVNIILHGIHNPVGSNDCTTSEVLYCKMEHFCIVVVSYSITYVPRTFLPALPYLVLHVLQQYYVCRNTLLSKVLHALFNAQQAVMVVVTSTASA